jgi:hypothetical protein
MDEAETQHLFDLARAASDDTRARRAAHPSCRSAHGPKPSTSILIPSQHHPSAGKNKGPAPEESGPF